jgi:hypothetical protein
MSHICPCPNPPGGQIVCRVDQLAMCGFRDGKIVSGCFDKPSQVRQGKSEDEKNLIVANWSLSMITGISRPLLQSLDNEDLQVLQSGEYQRRATLIKFSLPRDLELASTAQGAPLVHSH